MKLLPLTTLVGSSMGAGLFNFFPGRTWGSWGRWSECDGNQQRTRQAACLSGLPRCQSPLIEKTTEGCKRITWGQWGNWGLCNPRTRQRQRMAPCVAGKPVCYNPLIERMSCGEQRIWSEWQSWSECDATTKQRSRQAACLAGAPQCNNDLVEREDCDTVPQPETWGAWGAWSSCSNGRTVRTAPCFAGCTSPLTEEKDCYTPLPPRPVSLPQCAVTVSSDVCATNPPLTELNGALCAFNTLCVKKPEIFRPTMFAQFAPYKSCGLSTIHHMQRCLASQSLVKCSGLNAATINNCWSLWKRNDYWMGNILTSQG